MSLGVTQLDKRNVMHSGVQEFSDYSGTSVLELTKRMYSSKCFMGFSIANTFWSQSFPHNEVLLYLIE